MWASTSGPNLRENMGNHDTEPVNMLSVDTNGQSSRLHNSDSYTLNKHISQTPVGQAWHTYFWHV